MCLRLFILILFSVISILNDCKAQSFSFFVAGHAYGAHAGANIGLHPPFLAKAGEEMDSSVFAIFLTGDLVNQSTQSSWDQVALDLDSFGIPSYYSMGNHDQDDLGYSVFNEKYGNTYYSLNYNNSLFIVLNSTIGDRQISTEQLTFLKNCLDNTDAQIENVFLFFHEILWNTIDEYSQVLSNSRSRYGQMKNHSNYWTDVHPLLASCGKPVYIFTGDVGGNTDANALFYDQWNNVTLISSGMGEVKDENFLRVDVSADKVFIKPISLNNNVELKPLEFYSVPEMPDTIFGPSMVETGITVEYSVPDALNATEYLWTLANGMTGSSSTSTISIDFSAGFEGGELGVQAMHPGFGVSEMKTLKISSNLTSVVLSKATEPHLSWFQQNELLIVRLSGFPFELYNLKIIDLNGRTFDTKVLEVDSLNMEVILATSILKKGIFVLQLDGQTVHRTVPVLLQKL